MTFDVGTKFQQNCQEIYFTLLQIFDSQYNFESIHFVKIISEYAATRNVKCINCYHQFAYIECINDFFYDNDSGTKVCIDEFDNIRYHLNYEPNDNNNYNMIQVLCKQCGANWQCATCSYMALECNYNENIGECIVCKSVICTDCAILLTDYCISKKYELYHTICEKCYNDDSIDDDIITKNVYDYNQEKSTSM